MVFGERIKRAGKEAMGKVKEATGNATDNDSMKNDGRGERAQANVKQAGDDIKDAAGQ